MLICVLKTDWKVHFKQAKTTGIFLSYLEQGVCITEVCSINRGAVLHESEGVKQGRGNKWGMG